MLLSPCGTGASRCLLSIKVLRGSGVWLRLGKLRHRGGTQVCRNGGGGGLLGIPACHCILSPLSSPSASPAVGARVPPARVVKGAVSPRTPPSSPLPRVIMPPTPPPGAIMSPGSPPRSPHLGGRATAPSRPSVSPSPQAGGTWGQDWVSPELVPLVCYCRVSSEWVVLVYCGRVSPNQVRLLL